MGRPQRAHKGWQGSKCLQSWSCSFYGPHWRVDVQPQGITDIYFLLRSCRRCKKCLTKSLRARSVAWTVTVRRRLGSVESNAVRVITIWEKMGRKKPGWHVEYHLSDAGVGIGRRPLPLPCNYQWTHPRRNFQRYPRRYMCIIQPNNY